MYVDDVTDAMLRALEQHGGVFNIGTGVETSVVDLFDAIRSASGADREPAFAPARFGELQRSVLDPTVWRRGLPPGYRTVAVSTPIRLVCAGGPCG